MTLPSVDPRTNPTRAALLDAAERLFSEKGYAAVGIREIAEAAGANLASIKYHFGSKSSLYVETVRRVMSRPHIAGKWDLLRDPPADREAAALILIRFIHGFLGEACHETDSPGCLMVRESLRPSEAFDLVIHDLVRPQKALLEALVAILMPRGTDQDAIDRSALSILGQVIHLRVFHQFYDRLYGRDSRDPREAAAAANHIARFSLRALGFNDTTIERLLARRQATESTAPAKENRP